VTSREARNTAALSSRVRVDHIVEHGRLLDTTQHGNDISRKII